MDSRNSGLRGWPTHLKKNRISRCRYGSFGVREGIKDAYVGRVVKEDCFGEEVVAFDDLIESLVHCDGAFDVAFEDLQTRPEGEK